MPHHAISGYENSGMSLAVDATGLGKPVVHLLNQEGLCPMSINHQWGRCRSGGFEELESTKTRFGIHPSGIIPDEST